MHPAATALSCCRIALLVRRSLVLSVSLLVVTTTTAQRVDTSPVVGLDENRPNDFAVVGGTVVTAPGKSLEKATIIVRDGRIERVAEGLEIPADVRTIDATGKTIYPGFIDSFSERSVESENSKAGYWNSNVAPERNALDDFSSTEKTSAKWRKQGFAVRLVAPDSGQIKGTSALITCSDGSLSDLVLQQQTALHISLTTSRRRGSQRILSGFANGSRGFGTPSLVRRRLVHSSLEGSQLESKTRSSRHKRCVSSISRLAV